MHRRVGLRHSPRMTHALAAMMLVVLAGGLLLAHAATARESPSAGGRASTAQARRQPMGKAD